MIVRDSIIGSWLGDKSIYYLVKLYHEIHETCHSIPSEEFEITANSLGAHIESHSGLMLRTLSYLTVNSQDDSHCELSVSLQLTHSH